MELAVAPLFATAARAVAFHQKEFGLRRIARLAVGEFARERHPFQCPFAQDGLARGFGGFAGFLREKRFADDGFRIARILLQPFFECLPHYRFHGGACFGIAELGFSLAFKLKGAVLYFYRNYGGQALACILARERLVVLFEIVVLFGVIIECARERGAESGQVRASLAVIDIIGKCHFLAGQVVRVLECRLHHDFFITRDFHFFGAVKYMLMLGLFVAVEVLDVGCDPAFKIKRVGMREHGAILCFFVFARVYHCDVDRACQICLLADVI